MIIAVDFDGTVVEHKYPQVGAPVPNAAYWLKQFVDSGAKLILWTMRSGKQLEDAIEYCANRGIKLWGVNKNPDQQSWTDSNKAHAHVYIDDAAFGCPLVDTDAKPYVNWEVVGPEVMKRMAGD